MRPKPLARLVPFRKPNRNRTLGEDKGRHRVPEDFNAPLPDSHRSIRRQVVKFLIDTECWLWGLAEGESGKIKSSGVQLSAGELRRSGLAHQ